MKRKDPGKYNTIWNFLRPRLSLLVYRSFGLSFNDLDILDGNFKINSSIFCVNNFPV